MCLNIQAVTACRRNRFFRIILRKLPSPLPPFVKGEVLSPEKIRATTGWIALRQHNYFNRRNLNRTLPQKAVTAYHRDRHILNYRFLCRPPFHYSANNSDNSKGGIYSGFQPQAEFEAAHCRPLSRCRLLRHRCLHTVSPSCRRRHNAPLYCPYIRQQGLYLPSFRRLYRRQ